MLNYNITNFCTQVGCMQCMQVGSTHWRLKVSDGPHGFHSVKVQQIFRMQMSGLNILHNFDDIAQQDQRMLAPLISRQGFLVSFGQV